MTKIQKKVVNQLRAEGYSYTKIAEQLGISINTIKSYCRRKNIGGVATPSEEILKGKFCKKCGEVLKQTHGKKLKQYCSDQCRMAWWNAHPEAIAHKKISLFTCGTCGKSFEGFGKRQRKYCSRGCYGKSRVICHE